MKIIHAFDQLPFYFTTGTIPFNKDLPNKLPFILGSDDETGRIIQCPNETVSATLEKAYGKGSLITGYMDEAGIGRSYADDFLKFIVSKIGLEGIRDSRILEIGCGTGYLLSRLKDLGAEVLGIEPGPQGQNGKIKYGIEILQDYFPISQKYGKFDLIIQYAVVEHLENPKRYLESVLEFLSEAGRIVIAVPSCDEQIYYGDISMLLHEHWSYFTQATLRSTIEASGYSVDSLEKAGFGGVWNMIASKGGPVCRTPDVPQHDNSSSFMSSFASNQQNLNRLLLQAANANAPIGFYCPGRIINSLLLANAAVDLDRLSIRFFDDNKLIQGQFYPGFPFSIEDGSRLLQEPVNILVIASWTFGERIKSRLVQAGYSGSVMTFQDIMAS